MVTPGTVCGEEVTKGVNVVDRMGVLDGLALGAKLVGTTTGAVDGLAEGAPLVGAMDGAAVGTTLGEKDGARDGVADGLFRFVYVIWRLNTP